MLNILLLFLFSFLLLFLSFTPVVELKIKTNWEKRIPTSQWWMCMRPLLRILAKHEAAYQEQGISVQEVFDEDALV